MRQGRHKYAAALKFKPKDLRATNAKAVDEELENLAALDAHLTLCSEKGLGKRRSYFSSCGVLAETQSNQAQNLKTLLEQANSTEGTLNLDFRLTWQSKLTSVHIKLHYAADVGPK